MTAGNQAVPWDGLDVSGRVRLIDRSDLELGLDGFALPENAVIVRGVPLEEAPRGDGSAAYPPAVKGLGAFLHAQHPRDLYHEIRFRAAFPRSMQHSPEDLPQLSGIIPIRVELDPRDRARLVNQGFEALLYENFTRFFSEEEHSQPLTFLWSASRLTSGEHLLTVNLRDHADHTGVFTCAIIVGKR